MPRGQSGASGWGCGQGPHGLCRRRPGGLSAGTESNPQPEKPRTESNHSRKSPELRTTTAGKPRTSREWLLHGADTQAVSYGAALSDATLGPTMITAFKGE